MYPAAAGAQLTLQLPRSEVTNEEEGKPSRPEAAPAAAATAVDAAVAAPSLLRVEKWAGGGRAKAGGGIPAPLFVPSTTT